MIYRLCERFGRTPDWFKALPVGEQDRLLAYERIREQEDAGSCPLVTTE